MKNNRYNLTQIFLETILCVECQKLKTMKNKTDQIEEQSLDDTLLKMKKIKELSEENFCIATPHWRHTGRLLLKLLSILDYVELLSILKSTLSVCILALEEQQDLTLRMKNKESDIIAVLEFA